MSKLLHLIAELGDLLEYTNTGWRYDDGWSNKWKNIPEPLPARGLPEPKYVCPCTTPIQVHCLIKHKSGSLHFVGSECIRRFGDDTKKCIRCGERNKCHTPMCAECRKLKFDDSDSESEDNNIGQSNMYKSESEESFDIDSAIETIEDEKQNVNPFILTEGKYKNIHIDKVDDDGYIQYLLKKRFSEWRSLRLCCEKYSAKY